MKSHNSIPIHFWKPSYISIRMAVRKYKCWWGWGEIGTLLTISWYVKDGVAAMDPQKIKNRIAIWPSNSTSEHIPKRIRSRDLSRYLYTHVQSSTIRNSRKVEPATCPSTDEWINKMWHTHCTMEYNSALKNEGNSDTCYNMHEPWRHYAEWNKPGTKG